MAFVISGLFSATLLSSLAEAFVAYVMPSNSRLSTSLAFIDLLSTEGSVNPLSVHHVEGSSTAISGLPCGYIAHVTLPVFLSNPETYAVILLVPVNESSVFISSGFLVLYKFT